MPALRAAADQRGRGASGSRQHVEERTARHPATRTCSVLGYWEWLDGPASAASPPTTPGCCRRSRRSSRSCSPAAWSRRCSPPRRSRSGINMPARSVVLEKLTQVERRDARRRDAGGVHPAHRARRAPRHRRRGPRRRAVAARLRPAPAGRARLHPHLPAALAASGRRTTWPSTSSAPSAASPRGRCSRARSRSSRPTAGVVGLARQVTRNLDALDGYREAMTCHLGDVQEYARLRADLKRREGDLARQGAAHRRAEAAQLAGAAEARRRHHACRPGRRSGLAVVLDPGVGARRRRPPAGAVRGPLGGPAVVGRLPAGRSSRSAGSACRATSTRARRRTGATWPARCAQRQGPPAAGRPGAALGGRRRRAARSQLRVALRRHPVHGCDDREAHLRWAERWARLRAETDALERKVEGRTHSIARTFDRVCAVLERAGLPRRRAGHRRPAGSSPGSTARPTCSSSSACAPGSGTTSRPPSWPRWCRPWSTRRAAPTTSARRCPRARCRAR